MYKNIYSFYVKLGGVTSIMDRNWKNPEITEWEDDSRFRDEDERQFLLGLGLGFILSGCSPRRFCFPRQFCWPGQGCWPR